MNVGIIGDGQLGWMTIFENRKLNYNFFVLGKNPNAPASKIADKFFYYEDVDKFLSLVDEVVVEFEHIPDFVFEKLENCPCFEALRIKRSRITEKIFLKEHGYPIVKFEYSKWYELEKKVKNFTFPVIIKAETLGYDGKGQYVIKSEEDLKCVLNNHSPEENFIIEELINFKYEVSAIGVRDKKGNKKIYPISFNYHESGILLYNYSPFIKNKQIEEIVFSLMDDFNIVGLLAVEFFITKDNNPLVNEFAPRPHNTGHYTMDGSYTSQFENLVRAVTGLPTGSTKQKIPTGMINILGKSLHDFEVNRILSMEGTKLYWYGKEKKQRRKMGHINVISDSLENVKQKINEILNIVYSKDFILMDT